MFHNIYFGVYLQKEDGWGLALKATGSRCLLFLTYLNPSCSLCLHPYSSSVLPWTCQDSWNPSLRAPGVKYKRKQTKKEKFITNTAIDRLSANLREMFTADFVQDVLLESSRSWYLNRQTPYFHILCGLVDKHRGVFLKQSCRPSVEGKNALIFKQKRTRSLFCYVGKHSVRCPEFHM